MEAYFRERYWRTSDGTDRERVLDLFAFPGGDFQGEFRTAASRFRMVESGMLSVIVPDPSGRVEQELAALRAGERSPSEVARALQTRLVQVPPRAREELVAAGDVQFVAPDRFADQFALLVIPRRYEQETGLQWERAGEFDGVVA